MADGQDSTIFLTGHLAEERLKATLEGLGLQAGSWRVVNIGIKVAALMTEAIVKNRLKGPLTASRIVVPGRSRMNLEHLGAHFGVPFERGPDELVDIPQYLGHGGRPPDLSKHALRIFAEIVEAPQVPLDALVARAYATQGRWRRRHRCRLPARRCVSRARGCDCRAQGAWAQGLGRQRQCRGIASGGAGGGRLCALTRRRQPGCRCWHSLCADPGAEAPWRSRQPDAGDFESPRDGHPSHCRSRARSHSFRLHDLARALCGAAPA